jgi:hypothetical protein
MTDDSDADPKIHFIKQRRNLVLISVFLILINLGGVNFKELSILGNSATINNPNLFYWIIILSSLYLFGRYYTAFNSINGCEEIKEAISSLLEKEKQEKLKLLISKFLEDQKLDPNNLNSITFIDMCSLDSITSFSKNNPCLFFGYSGNQSIKEYGIKNKLKQIDHNRNTIFLYHFIDKDFRAIRRFAFFKILYKKNEIGEYIFPFIIYFFMIGILLSDFIRIQITNLN